MTEKMRAYLDGIFAVMPVTDEVKEAKEELYTSMVERYNDCLMEGMDEQQAYDTVIESVGDIRELLRELGPDGADIPYGETTEEKKNSFDLNEVIQSIGDFTSGLISGLFSTGSAAEPLELVNTRSLSLADVSNLEVSYLSEGIQLLRSENEELQIKEYMNRNEPELYGQITLRGSNIAIRNGRRQGVFGLRSRVEIYLPQSYEGGLVLNTVSGSVTSPESWKLASLHCRTISGEVDMVGVEAGMIRLSSTSGSVKLQKAAGTLDLHSISGSIRVNEVAGSGVCKTTSGNVRADFTELTGHVEATSISGGVRLTLPQDASFEFEGKTSSGGIYTGFDSALTFQSRHKAHGFVGTAPFHHIKATTTSGSIHVND